MTVSERVANLAVNHDGFVFDPSTGDSYILNQTGLVVVQGLQDGLDENQIAMEVATQFEVEADVAMEDVADFLARLQVMQVL